MLGTYKYLVPPRTAYSKKEVLTECVDIEAPLNSFNAFNMLSKVYYSFKTHADYVRYANSLPADKRVFHEVIFGNMPQKLKFDIDIKDQKALQAITIDSSLAPSNQNDATLYAPDANEKTNYLLHVIMDAVQNMFYIMYRHFAPLLLFHSCEGDSYHIIVDKYCVNDNLEAQNFTRAVLSSLPLEYHKFIDIGVNKRIQNFRMMGCCKPANPKHVKTPVSESITFEQSLITYTEKCIKVGAQKKTPQSPQQMHSSEDLEVSHSEIIDIAAEYAAKNNSEFSHHIDNLYIYKRKGPAHCELCKRTHDADNTMLVFVLGKTVKASCRRELDKGATARLIDLGTLNAENEIKHVQNYKPPSTDAPLVETFAACKKHLYMSPEMESYELAPTMFIKAHMKMGKTNKLRELINTHFSSAHSGIVFISFRQTFSSNIKMRFPDMTLYSDVRGPLNQRKKIVQVESLHRIPISAGTEPPDLLILDESESIIEQFSSGLLKNFNGAFAVFEWLMKYSKNVICMDANLGARTYNVVTKFRGAQNCMFHYNMFKNATADRYEILHKACFIVKLLQDITDGKRICCPVSSLQFARGLHKIIKSRFPHKNVFVYSSETLQSVKKEHFADINKKWKEYDVLIYTPTITAGLSFEQEHYDVIYAYFTHFSCPVETCMQMLGRIRNVATHQYFVCIDWAHNNMPTEQSEILKSFSVNRASLIDSAEHLTYSYAEDGALKYHDNPYLTVWVENVRTKNLSYNNFLYRFIDFVYATGASYKMLPKKVACEKYHLLDVDLVLDEFMTGKACAKMQVCDIVAQSRELEFDEVCLIQDKMQAQEDIIEADRRAYEKYKLRDWYKFHAPMTAEFVDTYGPFEIKMAFKNLQRAIRCATFANLLSVIQDTERRAHLNLIKSKHTHTADIFKNYTYATHKLLLNIYIKNGLESLNGNCGKMDIDLNELKQLCQTLRITAKINKTNALKILNTCSLTLYQIQLIYRTNYSLVISSIFSLDDSNEKVPSLTATKKVEPNTSTTKVEETDETDDTGDLLQL